MKTAVVIMVGIVIFACVQHHVESESEQKCGLCLQIWCRQVTCPCGGVKDRCGCCEKCYKCTGDLCDRSAIENCVPGTTCRGPRGPNALQAYNMQGKCV